MADAAVAVTASSTDAKGAAGAGSTLKKNPSDFLRQIIGKPVIVKLNSGVTYKGILACLDGFMNIAMEQTEEYHPDEGQGGLGPLKAKYGDCFIRGNNVFYISTIKSKK